VGKSSHRAVRNGSWPDDTPLARAEEATMASRMMINQWLVPVFLLGCLLFTFPLLSLFNSGDRVFGIPVLYAYLFTAWTLLIALMALAVERRH
jgi:hypothetical protein